MVCGRSRAEEMNLLTYNIASLWKERDNVFQIAAFSQQMCLNWKLADFQSLTSEDTDFVGNEIYS